MSFLRFSDFALLEIIGRACCRRLRIDLPALTSFTTRSRTSLSLYGVNSVHLESAGVVAA